MGFPQFCGFQINASYVRSDPYRQIRSHSTQSINKMPVIANLGRAILQQQQSLRNTCGHWFPWLTREYEHCVSSRSLGAQDSLLTQSKAFTSYWSTLTLKDNVDESMMDVSKAEKLQLQCSWSLNKRQREIPCIDLIDDHVKQQRSPTNWSPNIGVSPQTITFAFVNHLRLLNGMHYLWDNPQNPFIPLQF